VSSSPLLTPTRTPRPATVDVAAVKLALEAFRSETARAENKKGCHVLKDKMTESMSNATPLPSDTRSLLKLDKVGRKTVDEHGLRIVRVLKLVRDMPIGADEEEENHAAKRRKVKGMMSGHCAQLGCLLNGSVSASVGGSASGQRLQSAALPAASACEKAVTFCCFFRLLFFKAITVTGMRPRCSNFQ